MHTIRVKAVIKRIIKAPATTAVLLIRIYQNTLSLDHGPLRHMYTYGYCRHEPTCSEFTKQQIMKRGLLIGTAKGITQVLHCTPFTKPSASAIKKALHK